MPVLLVATNANIAAVYIDGDDVALPVWADPVRIDFGDGTPAVAALFSTPGTQSVHDYSGAGAGDYTIVATGRTPDGTPYSLSHTVTIPAPPALDLPMDDDAVEGALPADGPATAAGAKVGTPADAARVQDIVDAVNAQVRTWPTAERSRGLAAWWPPTVEGANMLVRRLWRRKDTPGGVEVYGDFGIAYVRRLDPDVAQLLELGDWSQPAVG